MAANRNSATVDSDDHDADMVVHWTAFKPRRWLAGALSGVLASIITLFLSSLYAVAMGYEVSFAAKLLATPFLGESAMILGMHWIPMLTGFVFLAALGSFLGTAFSHFVFTNHLPSLLAMGGVWGAFSWVFIWNLFFHSIRPLHFMAIPASGGLIPCFAFGISLASLAFFDRLVGGSKN